MDVLMPRAHGCAGAALYMDVLMPQAHGCARVALYMDVPMTVRLSFRMIGPLAAKAVQNNPSRP